MTPKEKILMDALEELKGYPDNSMISQHAIAETIDKALEQTDEIKEPSKEDKERLKKIFDTMVRKSTTNNAHWLSAEDFDFMYTNLKQAWNME